MWVKKKEFFEKEIWLDKRLHNCKNRQKSIFEFLFRCLGINAHFPFEIKLVDMQSHPKPLVSFGS